jgi:hypothetical protein
LPAGGTESTAGTAQRDGHRNALPIKRAITCLEPEVPASVVSPGNSDLHNYRE